MAEIITSTSQVYAGTEATTSKIVGINASKNYVARYQFSSDAKGANKVSWELTENYAGSGTLPPLRWYITTSSSSHINAGSSAAYHGAVTVTEYGGSYIFSGTANVVLKPSTIYYLWIFPNTTTYGFYWLKQNGTATVTTSGAALSVLNVSGTLELEKTLTLTVTKYSSSFTHTITYKCGSASGTICTKKSDTSLEFIPDEDLAKQNTTGTSVSITFSTATYDGNTLIGTTTKTVSCAIPASVKPSCEVTVTDPTGNAAFYEAYIKGISKFAVTITPTKAQGSDIASYKATANGATYVKASFTTDLLQSYGNLKVSATVTDKRGRSGSDTETLAVIDYIPPSITKLKVKRCDADGTENDQGEYVQVTFSASATPLNNKNTTAYVLEYKKATESQYTAVDLGYEKTYSITDGTCIFEADTGATYDIRLTLTDAFNGVSTSTVASTAFTIMHFKADGTGMAIGKVSEEPHTLDIAMDVKFRGKVEGVAPAAINLGSDNLGGEDFIAAVDPVFNGMASAEERRLVWWDGNGRRWFGSLFKANSTNGSIYAESGYGGAYLAPQTRRKENGVWGEWTPIRPGTVSITTTGEDLNNYTIPGWYYFKEAPTGIPGGVNGWLQVADAPGISVIKQLWYRLGTPGTNDYQTWVRTYSSNTGWGSWRRFLTADDAFLTATSLTLTTANQTDYTMTSISAYSRSGVVDVHIRATPVTSATSWVTVSTLPSGYRPPTNIYKDVPYWNATTNAQHLRLRITTAGAVQLNRGQVGSAYAFHDTFVMA